MTIFACFSADVRLPSQHTFTGNLPVPQYMLFPQARHPHEIHANPGLMCLIIAHPAEMSGTQQQCPSLTALMAHQHRLRVRLFYERRTNLRTGLVTCCSEARTSDWQPSCALEQP